MFLKNKFSQHIKEPNVLEIDKIGTGGLCYNLYAVSYRLQDGNCSKRIFPIKFEDMEHNELPLMY